MMKSPQVNLKISGGGLSPKLKIVKRILIVNTYFDDRREHLPQPCKVPQTLAPVYLAGAFDRNLCDVRIYNEHHSGPLGRRHPFAWPDMLVLTGLTSSFDRMKHITAYFRTVNPKIIVVAGGPAVRALPNLARRFFDFVCLGDVEEMREVIAETLGAAYVAPDMIPRYDLMNHLSFLGYVETSRNCNFNCRFCSLTGEQGRYLKYSIDEFYKQIIAMGPKKYLCFLDNNFYGDDRKFFLERLDVLKDLRKRGALRGWSALVTHDFFLKEDNLDRVREAGCVSLFSGVESINNETLLGFNKKQNTVLPQLTLLKQCMEAGIVFHYGLMFDLSQRSVESCRLELEQVLATPGIPLPSFVSLAIPLLGTPYFQDCVSRGRFVPHAKLRDCDGFTLALRPLDSLDRAIPFVADLPFLRAHRKQIARKTCNLLATYGKTHNLFQLGVTLGNGFVLCVPNWMNAPGRRHSPARFRTYVSTTEPLDPQYKPIMRVDARFESYFEPTMVSDFRGRLAPELARDYFKDGRRRPCGQSLRVTVGA